MATTSYGTPYVQSSDLVSGWPNASLNVANRIDEVSYAGNGINAQTGTTYTLVAGDAGKTVTLSNAAAVAVTLPQDSTANLPAGAVVNFYNLGAGTVTISAGAGATLQGTSLTLAQYGHAAIIKLSANTYGAFPGPPTTPGLSIITPTSTANSGGSVTATGGQITFTNITSLSLNGIFSSTYDNYQLVIRALGSADDFVTWRLRLSGTDATGANYDWNYLPVDTAVNTPSRSTGQTSMRYGRIGTSTGTTQLFISGPALAAPTHSNNTVIYGLGISQIFMTGYHSLSTAYDGFTLIPVSGNLTGTIRVYGFKNS